MKKKLMLGLGLALINIDVAQAMEFKHGPWTLNAGVNATVLYGYNKYPKKYKTAELFYFDGRSNFGDCLNLYIIQRLLDYNVKKAHIMCFSCGMEETLTK